MGRAGAELAGAHLQRRGLRVLARGARTAGGEIDLIALDAAAGAIVFVDVRTARHPDEQWAREWLRPPARAGLRALALEWLEQTSRTRPAAPARFDAIAVIIDGRGRLRRLDHVEGAW